MASPDDDDEEEVAFLLTECSRIATREVACEPPLVMPIVDQLAKAKALPVDLSTAVSFDQEECKDGEPGDKSCLMTSDTPPHPDDAPTLLQWRNLRGESVSPPTTVLNKDISKKGATKGRPRLVSFPVDSKQQDKEVILRRKFSWRHYPVLERFLIANRTEYLRHSAMNYTSAQKKFNNKLTERTIKLATRHGYEFDAHEFKFNDIRDRIRCYYKVKSLHYYITSHSFIVCILTLPRTVLCPIHEEKRSCGEVLTIILFCRR